MATKLTTRFRDLLRRPDLLVMPGGFSPLHARMSEALGYEAFFMSGSQVAAYLYGYPDVGLLGLGEMVEAARRLSAGCNIPIFADADTGYGNAVNVHHAVKEFIRAGAAGLHIEDQESPKKSGTLAGRRLISEDEAVGKYQAAVVAKKELDEDFVICARCDSIGSDGGSFEDAMERSIAYVKEARVDAVWVNTLQSREEIREACRRIPAPVIAPYYGPPPAPSFAEFQDLGAAAVLFPSLTTANGLQATWELMHEFKQRGPAVLAEWNQRASQPMGRRSADKRAAARKRKDSHARRKIHPPVPPARLRRHLRAQEALSRFWFHGSSFWFYPGREAPLSWTLFPEGRSSAG